MSAAGVVPQPRKTTGFSAVPLTAGRRMPSYKPGSKKQQLVDAVCVPMAADQLIKKLAIDLGSLQAMLFELSMDGVICQDGMGYWKRL